MVRTSWGILEISCLPLRSIWTRSTFLLNLLYLFLFLLHVPAHVILITYARLICLGYYTDHITTIFLRITQWAIIIYLTWFIPCPKTKDWFPKKYVKLETDSAMIFYSNLRKAYLPISMVDISNPLFRVLKGHTLWLIITPTCNQLSASNNYGVSSTSIVLGPWAPAMVRASC
jgi:hypothetical protein